jgi:hypothetical protein
MLKMKRARLEVGQWLLFCYESESNDFLYNIVMWDKSWVHHYEVLREKSFNDTAIDQDSLQNFHIPDHISTDLSMESKSKIAWLKTTHSTYHLTINTMFNLHVWQLPHFISSIWTKILKQNMFHTVYNYKVNLYFADEELGQIIALQYRDSTRKKAKCRASVHT